MSDVDRGAIFNEAEEFGCQIFMQADAAMGAGAMFHPAGMKAVMGLEFAPVGHGSAFETPSGWLVAQVTLAHLIGIVGITMTVGPMLVDFSENAKMSLGCRS